MADDTDELLLDTTAEDQDQDVDQDQGEQQVDDTPSDDIAIEIEGEEAVEETPLIKKLRDTARDAQRELAEERKAKAQPAEVGPEPDLWDDCEGDADKYRAALLKWHDDTRRADQAAQQQREQLGNTNREFERAVTNYRARAIAMKIPDIEGAEKKVADQLGAEMTGFIVQYADDPAKLIAALSTYPAKLSQIADEPDNIKRMKALLKLEGQIKVTNRKAPPPPEAGTIQRGTVPLTASSKRLAELEKKADATGDRTELIRYRQSLKK